MKLSKLAIPLLLFLAGACSPQADERPTLRIVLSPSAHPVRAAVAACMQEFDNLTAIIEMRHPSVVDLTEIDFFVQLGEPEQQAGFAGHLAVERVVVILHPSNKMKLSRAYIADLFSGRVQDWGALGGEELAVNLWVGSDSDETRRAFETEMLLGSPVAGSAHLVTNPEKLLAAVAADPAAAGILPAAWVNESVLAIETGIELPVLALAAEEPSGAAREVLACLQGEVGQAALGELYAVLEPQK
ncbi:MAG: hypothetical protein WD740_07245 [Anaerolineales bacterium]